MQTNTTPTPHPTDPPGRPPVPAELLETVARALAAALIPRSPAARTARRQGAGLPDRRAARRPARRLPGDGPAARDRRDVAAYCVCRGTRKTTRRFPRRFADDFAASGLDVADLAAFAAAWRARITAPAR